MQELVSGHVHVSSSHAKEAVVAPVASPSLLKVPLVAPSTQLWNDGVVDTYRHAPWKATKGGRPFHGSTIVDISQLQRLPQKRAATLMGFSRSMLNKRFKEVSLHAWPCRQMYLLKRTIAQIENIMRRDGNTLNLEHDLAGTAQLIPKKKKGNTNSFPIAAHRELADYKMPVCIRFNNLKQLLEAQENLKKEIPGVEIHQLAGGQR